MIKRKWGKVTEEVVLHEEFGDKPVCVFVIALTACHSRAF